MPGLDGTGPQARGPMSGGARGFCSLPAGRDGSLLPCVVPGFLPSALDFLRRVHGVPKPWLRRGGGRRAARAARD